MLGLKLLFVALFIAIVFLAVAFGGMSGLYGPGSPLDQTLKCISLYAIVATILIGGTGAVLAFYELSR